jgi:signal transduction histidine kinase/ActR/RegA family two-component response regulator
MTARRAIQLLGGGLLLLLLATTVYSGWVLRQHEIDDWRHNLDSLSLVLAESTAQTMSSSYQVLDSMVETAQALDGHGPQPLAAALREQPLYQGLRDKISGLPQIDVATFVAADGTVLNFTRSYPAPAINLAERDYFRYHQQHADSTPYLSAPVRNKGNGKWTFYLSRRLSHADGSFAGVALVGVACDFLSGFYSKVSLGQHAAVTLYRRDLTMLARWPMAEQLMGKQVTNGSTHAVISQGKNHDVVLSSTPRAADNERQVLRMGAVRMVRDYPLIINATITEDLLLEGWWRSLRLLGSVALVGALALVWALWVVGVLLRRRERDAEQAQWLGRQANAASEAKSRFLAMMSHEIRTPMSAIAGMSELMLQTPLSAEQRGYAANVHRGVTDLMHIINEVLDFSKIEAGQMTLETLEFEPAALLRQVVALHQAAAAAKGLRLELALEAGPQWLRGDPARLRQVLGNLVNNAIKFSSDGAIRIACRAWADGAAPAAGRWWLELAVEDSGIGIDVAAQGRLFEPFSQADAHVSSKYGGTGLGLAICKRLVHLMGGDIVCHSVPGQGSRFAFSVPCQLAAAPAAAATLAVVPAPGPEAAADAIAAGAPRVLVAEDTEMNRQLARILMTRMGWQVDEAANGALALEAMAAQRYDLVLMDCMMPDMNGYDASREQRRREQAAGAPRMPIIALTASAIEGDRVRCLEAGMDDYLSKPYTGAQLQAMVGRWYAAPPPAPQAARA